MGEVDIIASILEVAGTGLRLSLFLNAISCDITTEGVEAQAISKSVTMFCRMLKQTGALLGSEDSVHSYDAVTQAKTIADESNLVFEEIQDMLDRVQIKRPDGTYVPTAEQRFKWCFKQHRVTYLLGQLESLKMSLSVLQEVCQLGKMMAATSKLDRPEDVAIKTEAIKQQRAETQNMVIIRFWEMSKLDQLFEASLHECEEDMRLAAGAHADEKSLASSESSQLTLVAAPPEYAPSTALVKLPVYSLGERDQTLQQIKQSPKEMLQVSDDYIDGLLQRLTRWHEVREQRHVSRPGNRREASVQNLNDEDEEQPFHEKFQEREDNPRGFYLEGTTTNWRQPNSGAARHEALQRRKQYSTYQPSVSADSSEVEDSPGSRSSQKRSPRHHILDSSSESSESEIDKKPKQRRRSSGSPTTERKIRFSDGPIPSQSYGASQFDKKTPSPRESTSTIRPTPSLKPAPNMYRPYMTPDQSFNHRSLSSPGLQMHPNNTLTPYSSTGSNLSPYVPQPLPTHGQQYSPHNRYAPSTNNRMVMHPRPGSQDGKSSRSPSRLQQQQQQQLQSSLPRSNTKSEESKRQSREKVKHNLREGATKGLLGAGAIGTFLEVLEGLSI